MHFHAGKVYISIEIIFFIVATKFEVLVNIE